MCAASFATITGPSALTDGAVEDAWRLMLTHDARLLYQAVLTGQPHPYKTKRQFLRGCGNTLGKPCLQDPSGTLIYKVMAVLSLLIVFD